MPGMATCIRRFFFPVDEETAVNRVEQARSAMVKLALSLNGTCTGEHGVGLGKQKYMLAEHGPNAIHLMRQLKTTLDPHNILNPGKVLPELG